MTSTQTTKTTVRFSDREFVRSHGRAPRGRGSWFFFCEDEGMPGKFVANGTFTEARAAAKAFFASAASSTGARNVWVEVGS